MTVDDVPGFMPVTVMRPLGLIVVVLPSEFVPDHVNEASQFPICNVKPSAVEVAVSNVGIRPALI